MTEKIGLKTENLSVGYGKKILLSGVGLEVKAGKILTLIGPNGSGKSTILKTITRQLRTLGGKILLLDRDMEELPGEEIAKTLSMVMTERPTPELMTCREVVGTGRYPYVGLMGILGKEDWKKVEEALETVSAKEVADKSFYEISDGQRQRVMLARALCQEPRVLVLDEPTSYLDMRFKLDILESIRRLAKERKIAIIMSLHELDLAMKVSDEIACVDGIGISRLGTPEEVFRGTYVQELYGVSKESYEPLTGELFLSSKGIQPKVFVIGGGGEGIPTYYRLQREEIPFAAGILFENDLEMAAARACASKVISVAAFSEMGEEALKRAKECMDECETVFCPLTTFGPLNEANKALLEYAQNCGKLKNVLE
jgi:iron complex transport system ATP-binding protein